MATVLEIVTDALEDILVHEDEGEIEASEMRTAIRALNRIMNRLAAKGINLGYTEVSKSDDTITVPNGALDGVTTLLALRLAPKYKVEASYALLTQAAEGLKAIQRIAVKFTKSQMPNTLPLGSGNVFPGSGQQFYIESSPSVLSEFSGSISLESIIGG